MTPDDPDFYIDWQPTLRTVFTGDDIARIITAIESHKATSPLVTTSHTPPER